jgi:ribonuclease P protein component
VRKEETLRGRGSFQSLYRSGRKVDGEVLRCFFRWEPGAGTLVRAGFSISAKRFNAVKRNRAKRIMRAAYASEREFLTGAAASSGGRLSVLFVYSGENDPGRVRLDFSRVSGDMTMVCRKVCAMAEKART